MKISHDFHIHTNLSICADRSVGLDTYIENARKSGLKKIGIANHFWDNTIECGISFYNIQNYEHLAKIIPEIKEKSNDELKIYFGCEAEYDYKHRGVSITEETAEKFDYILVPNSHTHLTMPKDFYEPYQKHVDYMIQAYTDIINSNVSKYITAIAHPFQAVRCPYPNDILVKMISDDMFKRLFTQTAEAGIAYEINTTWMNKKTQEEIADFEFIRMYRLAKESGCKFIFGSDSHKGTEHEKYSNAEFVADLLGLDENDILDIAR